MTIEDGPNEKNSRSLVSIEKINSSGDKGVKIVGKYYIRVLRFSCLEEQEEWEESEGEVSDEEPRRGSNKRRIIKKSRDKGDRSDSENKKGSKKRSRRDSRSGSRSRKGRSRNRAAKTKSKRTRRSR